MSRSVQETKEALRKLDEGDVDDSVIMSDEYSMQYYGKPNDMSDPVVHVFGAGVMKYSTLKKEITRYLSSAASHAERGEWESVAWDIGGNGMLPAYVKTAIAAQSEMRDAGEITSRALGRKDESTLEDSIRALIESSGGRSVNISIVDGEFRVKCGEASWTGKSLTEAISTYFGRGE